MYDLPQALRFVGKPVSRPFIDVIIKGKTIPGLVNTAEIQSSIDETLAKFVLGWSMFSQFKETLPTEMRVPIKINGKQLPLKCKVRKMEPGIHLKLAMDFTFFEPFELTVNRLHVTSQKYWNMNHHEDIDFVYNHPRGAALRRKLTAIQQDNFENKTTRKF